MVALWGSRQWEGKQLGPNEYVISADEKTSIQARCRCHPTLPPDQARMIRVPRLPPEGPVAYLAAYDIPGPEIHSRCEGTTGVVTPLGLC